MSTALLASIDTRKLKSKELADTIMRLKNMSRGGYEKYNQNEDALARLLRKARFIWMRYCRFTGMWNWRHTKI